MRDISFWNLGRVASALLLGVLLCAGCWKRADDRRSPTTGAAQEQREPQGGGAPQQSAQSPSATNEGVPDSQAGGDGSARGELSPKQIAERALPAVVIVQMETPFGQDSQGSGFYVKPQVIVTNHHVIEGASEGMVKGVYEERGFPIEEVLASDKEMDLALLSTSQRSGSTLALAESDAGPSVGDRVYAAGNPQGLEGTFSQGIVSGLRRLNGHPAIQVTAPISPGSSGGPLLDSNGRVIGVITSMAPDGQNLNFAVPASAVTTLLSRIGSQ